MCSDGGMSTVDPDAARRARAARVPTIKDLFVPGILAFAGAGGLMTCVLMMAREPAADEVSAHTGWLLVAMTGALIGGLAAIVGLIFWVRLSVKNLRLPGWAAPIALPEGPPIAPPGFGGLLKTKDASHKKNKL